jgi:hypothetical protein
MVKFVPSKALFLPPWLYSPVIYGQKGSQMFYLNEARTEMRKKKR